MRTPTLKQLWDRDKDISYFVIKADRYGYGLWSIRDFLKENYDENITEDEIDKIRMGE